MPFLPADEASSMSLLMPNSFLIFRLVSFALLSNLALLQVIFASWNISASLSIGLSAPSTSVFIILESCVLFFCVAFIMADFLCSGGRRSRILLECSWVGIMSLFQIGVAISSTATGPGMVCYTSLEWSVCASSSLLVPSTWLSSILFLAYFLTLFITTMAHRYLYPDIWKRSMYGVAWFGRSHEIISKDVDPYIDHYADIESSSARKRLYPISDPIENVAPWATNRVRRGVDPPFSRQPIKGTSSNRSSPTGSTSDLSNSFPSYPNKSAKVDTGSRFIEKFRESTLLARSESLEHFVANYQTRQDSFPPSVLDVDAPIPLPRLSEWVRADALRGLSVHTLPRTEN
ncbi:hypothetical protein BYT27DRAFT_7203618 [Phlegmacium glaucopus]|nr:hypothetical protein BYT27DRAFT_7203618 [Phlegmacium glaucopus]